MLKRKWNGMKEKKKIQSRIHILWFHTAPTHFLNIVDVQVAMSIQMGHIIIYNDLGLYL